MPERPILKLKLPKPKAPAAVSTEQPTNPGTGTKLKLKISGGKKAKIAAEPQPKTSKPKPKIVFKQGKAGAGAGGKKRKADDGAASGGAPASAGGIKRLKLTAKNTPKTPTTPFIRLKARGRPPVKPPGISYDSEASDAEEDPHIEEEFILRMQPGEDCDYLRNAIANKNWGPVSQGGADVKLKFLRHDGRRAILTIRGKMYAASMVDLPCVVEGMKSWDKKGWWKTADISQMLLVLGPIKTEDEAAAVALPEGDVKKGTFLYEHGLTPPMKWARKRRFRKRVSTNIVMQVEQEVEDLFRRDAEALGSDYKLQTWDEIEDEQRALQGEDDYFDDADGEMNEQMVQYEGELEDAEGEDADADADADEWEALMEDMDQEQDSQAATRAATPAAAVMETQDGNTDSEAATPREITAVIDATDEADTPIGQAGDEDEEDSGSDADEDDADEEADEGQLEYQRKKDEIADLQKAIAQKTADLANIRTGILRTRQLAAIKSLQDDLQRQKAAIGEGDEDD